MIITTDLGLNAIANANAGGFLVSFSKFAVTSDATAVPSLNSTVLVGDIQYEGAISNIEVLSGSSVKLTLEVPRGIPHAGSFDINEIGVFLSTGELFAHGIFPTTYTKSSQYGLVTYVIVSAVRLGEVANISVPKTASLASVSAVRSLQNPATSDQNAVVVSDALTYDDTSTGGGMAIKFGSGGLSWGYLGYNRVFHDFGATVIDTTTFRLDAGLLGGFWLNDGEVVIIQVYSGAGMGESRRVMYHKANNEFTVLEKPFSALDANSTLSIWRDTSHQLPARLPTMSENLMLGVGRNTFAHSIISSNAMALVPSRADSIATGTQVFAAPAVNAATNASQVNYMVWVDGTQLQQAQFTVSSTSCDILIPVSEGAHVSVVALEMVSSTGGLAVINEAQYDVPQSGITDTFNLPVVLDVATQALVFVNKSLIPLAAYSVVGANIVFAALPTAGDVIDVVIISNFNELGATSYVVQAQDVATATYAFMTLNALEIVKKNTIVMFDGKLVDKALYYTSPNTIHFYDYVPYGTVIHVTTLVAGATTPQHNLTTGENTGPVWTDPAGLEGLPNMVTSTGVSYITGVGQRVYTVPVVTNKTRIMAFVGTEMVDPSDFTYLNGEFSFLRTTPPAGLVLDITCYTETSALDSGCSPLCWSARFASSAVTYILPDTVNSAWETLVFVNGSYLNKSQFTAVGNVLTLNVAPSAVYGPTGLVYVHGFKVVPNFGQRMEFYYEPKEILVDGDTILKYQISDINNLVMVVNSTVTEAVYSDTIGTTSSYMNKSIALDNGSFTLGSRVTGEVSLDATPDDSIPSAPFFPMSWTAHLSRICNIHSMYSDVPRTRLMSRAEADTSYLRVGPTGKIDGGMLDPALAKRVSGYRFAYAQDLGVFSGLLMICGANDVLGIGSYSAVLDFTPIDGNSNWSQVCCGSWNTIALKDDGSMWTWGQNLQGQCGFSKLTPITAPSKVGVDLDWLSVSAGDSNFMAIKKNGTLWGSGAGSILNQPGVATSNFVQINQDTDWSRISCGDNHATALKTNGDMWTWGDNSLGQLGVGAAQGFTFAPIRVGNLSTWKVMATGDQQVYAIQVDGTLWAWGQNAHGQLAQGDLVNRFTPVQVGTATSWVSVSAGVWHFMAIRADGTMWGAGYNFYGQLGNGTQGATADVHTLIQVGTDDNWVKVYCGAYYNFAIKTDGTLWSWGWNNSGQLGLGHALDVAVPTQISIDVNMLRSSAFNENGSGGKAKMSMFIVP